MAEDPPFLAGFLLKLGLLALVVQGQKKGREVGFSWFAVLDLAVVSEEDFGDSAEGPGFAACNRTRSNFHGLHKLGLLGVSARCIGQNMRLGLY